MKHFFHIVTLSLAFLLSDLTISAQVERVDAPGITVKDMNTSLSFYTQVLGFKKISDKELSGEPYEKLEGIFGLHSRVVRLQLGDEQIELTDYLTSGGRSVLEDARPNDLSF